MKKHAENAAAVAGYLDNHNSVEKVYYPGLASNQDHELAKKYMKNGYGGMVSFELKGGYEAGKSLMNHVKLCTLAVSLGNVDTLIQHPASMTHAVMSPEARERTGITDGLVRISVGTEAVDDIIMDLEQALSYATVSESKV
jgi:methionine-gamma-lyase